MREIKFRAYAYKKMYSWSELLEDDLKALFTSPDCPLMQYTGLKDKNGKECFDSDLIKDIDGEVLEIRWDENVCRFRVHYLDSLKYRVGHLELEDIKPFEVIGNIYENPELMKEVK